MNLFFLSAVTSPSRPNSSTILSWFPHLKCVSSTSESPTFEGTWNGNIYYTRWIKNSPTSASRVTQSTMRFFRTRRTFPRVNFFSFSLPLKQPAFYYYYYNIIRVSVPSFLSCMAVIWAHARTPFLVRSFQIIDSTVTHSSSPHRYDDSNTIAICEYRVDTYFMRWSLTPFLYYFPPRLQRSHSHLTTHTIWGDCYANLRNVQQLCFLVL